MFFLPTICGLQNRDNHDQQHQQHQQQGQQLWLRWLLCLSNGNYNGLGATREIELHRAGGYLGFDRIIVPQVVVVVGANQNDNNDNTDDCGDDDDDDDKELQDSPTRRWSKHAVARVLEDVLPKSGNHDNGNDNDNDTEYIIRLYTFDEKGVSGHVNHVDTYLGVQFYLQNKHRGQTQKGTIEGFQLVTEDSLLRKYLPVVHWIVLLYTFVFGRNKKMPLTTTTWTLKQSTPTTHATTTTTTTTQKFTLYQPWINWKCMAFHASQFVWYRRLFVIFCCYTYENQWRPIVTIGQQQSSQDTQKG